MSTPLTKQQIIDQTSIELAKKICENMKGSGNFEQSIISITVNSIKQAFEDPKTQDSFTNALINGIKHSFRFIKGSNILFYSILSDENGKKVYSELVEKALSKSVTHTIEVDNFIDYLISEFNTIIRQKQNFLFENDEKTGGGGDGEIATELAENVAAAASETAASETAASETAASEAAASETAASEAAASEAAASETAASEAAASETAASETATSVNNTQEGINATEEGANATEEGANATEEGADDEGLNPKQAAEVEENKEKINDLVTGLFKEVEQSEENNEGDDRKVVTNIDWRKSNDQTIKDFAKKIYELIKEPLQKIISIPIIGWLVFKRVVYTNVPGYSDLQKQKEEFIKNNNIEKNRKRAYVFGTKLIELIKEDKNLGEKTANKIKQIFIDEDLAYFVEKNGKTNNQTLRRGKIMNGLNKFNKTIKNGVQTGLDGLGINTTSQSFEGTSSGGPSDPTQLLNDYTGDLLKGLNKNIGQTKDLIAKKINNSVYSHIRRNPGVVLNSLSHVINSPNTSQNLTGLTLKILICSCLTNNSLLVGSAMQKQFQEHRDKEEENKEQKTDNTQESKVYVTKEEFINGFTDKLLTELEKKVFLKDE